MHYSVRNALRRNIAGSNITVLESDFKCFRCTNNPMPEYIAMLGTDSMVCRINALEHNHRLILLQSNSGTTR